jgi:hypothetical protein
MESVISRDAACLRQEAKEELKTHNQDKQPEENQCCLTGINQILKLSQDTVNTSDDRHNTNKIQ